jgi:hypothetical protein
MRTRAALCGATAYIFVGHRSVYGSQRLGYSKTSGLDIPLHIAVSELDRHDIKVVPGSMSERSTKWHSERRAELNFVDPVCRFHHPRFVENENEKLRPMPF